MAKVLSQKQQPVLINVLSGFTKLKWPPNSRHQPVLMDDLFGWLKSVWVIFIFILNISIRGVTVVVKHLWSFKTAIACLTSWAWWPGWAACWGQLLTMCQESVWGRSECSEGYHWFYHLLSDMWAPHYTGAMASGKRAAGSFQPTPPVGLGDRDGLTETCYK